MTYTPDKWVILKITPENKSVWYRLLGGWYGGYLGSDSWQLNSGITKIEDTEHAYLVHGVSGSVYTCYKSSEGMSGYMNQVFDGFVNSTKDSDIKIEVISIQDYFNEVKNGME